MSQACVICGKNTDASVYIDKKRFPVHKTKCAAILVERETAKWDTEKKNNVRKVF